MGKIFAVVVAAGKSTRMGGNNKQLLSLAGVPVLVRSLAALDKTPRLDGIVLVVPEDSLGRFRKMSGGWDLKKLTDIVPGGDNRQQSVYSGLLAVPSGCALIMVHDGARPLVTVKEIEDVMEAAAGCGAATLAVPVKDTVKEAGSDGYVARTPDRSRLWLTLTPQCFSFGLLLEAHERALESGLIYTDDASLVEAAGRPVLLVQGSYSNIKITTPEDLAVAEALLKGGDGREIPMRVGFGYDVHRLVPGRKLILGGVEIPYEKGLEGHSDADVLVHAIMDALLGAAGMGDIGRHFPDTDPAYRGISSLRLLGVVKEKLAARGFRAHNLDSTIVAQAPRLSGHIEHMTGLVAGALGIDESSVNIKATTTEGLGFAGAGEGIASYAVALVENI